MVQKKRSFQGSKWDITTFEKVADDIDSNDTAVIGEPLSRQSKLSSLSRPYLISAGIQEGINYIFCMSPLMLSEAQFIEADITYNETVEYPYLFNAAVFNYVTMEWVVTCRIRMDKQYNCTCASFFQNVFKM